jgi:4-alpha-glucanotransferase
MNFPRASGILLHPTTLPGYLIRAIMSSVSNTAIAPMQDILGLSNEARMTLPSTSGGNWKWHMKPGAATTKIATRLKGMVTLYDR